MRRLYLATTPDLQNRAQAEDISDVFSIEQVDHLDVRHCEIVVLGGSDAKEAAFALAARGLDRTLLSYIDLTDRQPVKAQIATPKHLFWDDVVPLSELRIEEDFPVYPSGIEALDRHLAWGWRIPELVVIAGPYGCGKSTIGQLLAANFVQHNGVELESGALLCSWEDLDSEVYRNISTFGDTTRNPSILNNIHFVRRSSSEDRLVSWFIDLVCYHKARYGTKFFFLDPWNEMDHVKDTRQSETEYTRDIMKELRRVVDQEKIILVLATHISAKYIKGDGSLEPFKIGHAFGSSQFGNKADRGLCICRAKKWDDDPLAIGPTKLGLGHTLIRLDKSKIERRMGKKGTIAVRFDARDFCLRFDPYVTEEARTVWKD